MDKIAVIDNGGQYTHLIATKIRSFNVYSEILSPEEAVEKAKEFKGIIFSGSPFSVYDEKAPKINKEIYDLGIPILGICYGLQLMAFDLNGKVEKKELKEYGKAMLTKVNNSELFEGLENEEQVWMSHGDSILEVPPGFEIIGSTSDCKEAAVQNKEKNLFGVQFHPEVVDTPKGDLILKNFVLKVCKAKQEWDMKAFLNKEISEIKKKVGDKEVLLLASGGVDSTVLAFLLIKAIPKEKLHIIHIDNGFMRKGESKFVINRFSEIGVDAHLINASDEFFNSIAEEVEPEAKRKIIGTEFINVSNREAEKLNLSNWLLAQGTIYPDTIESGATKHAAVIKTHHNRVSIIQEMIAEGKIIEPLNELYKVEVRELGKELGLLEKEVNRHPYPGPGLGVRILGNKEEAEDVSKLQEKLNDLKSDYSIEVLPVKSVGVKGDARAYEHPALIKGEKNWEKIEEISSKITNNVEGINRVVFQLGEYEKPHLIKALVTRERADLLREADDMVMTFLDEEGLYDKIWQFPVVLIPMKNTEGETIVLRPVNSKRAMTASFSKIDWNLLDKLTEKLLKIPGIGAVFYDVTNKPPGTIEWE